MLFGGGLVLETLNTIIVVAINTKRCTGRLEPEPRQPGALVRNLLGRALVLAVMWVFVFAFAIADTAIKDRSVLPGALDLMPTPYCLPNFVPITSPAACQLGARTLLPTISELVVPHPVELEVYTEVVSSGRPTGCYYIQNITSAKYKRLAAKRVPKSLSEMDRQNFPKSLSGMD